MNEIIRTHDEFYLKENRYKKTKQLFEDVIEMVKKVTIPDEEMVISDHGCAAGEFPYVLRDEFPNAKIEGYDLLENLIEKARIEVPNADFFVGSITDQSLCEENHSNVTLCIGVLSIFDSFEPIISNLLHWTKPGGYIFLHGLFNDFPIDVNIKYNLSANYENSEREAGWNLFSKESVARWLGTQSEISDFEFIDYQIELDLEPQNDYVRSWTIKGEDGQRILTNGLCIMQPHSILRIKKLG